MQDSFMGKTFAMLSSLIQRFAQRGTERRRADQKSDELVSLH